MDRGGHLAGHHPVARAGSLVGWRPGALGWSPCGRQRWQRMVSERLTDCRSSGFSDELCEPDHTVPSCPGLHFHLLVTDLVSEGRVVMGSCYLPTAPEKNPGPPARQSAVCGEDLIYISICSGGAIIKITAAERPNFVFGQLIILGAVFVVALVELTLWLAD